MSRTRIQLSLATAVLAALAVVMCTAAHAAPPASTADTCDPPQLSMKLTEGSPGAGQREATLSMTNKSHMSCYSGGFPGMLLLAGPGKPVVTHVQWVDKGAAQLNYLHPGGTVKAQMHWSAIQGTGDKRSGPCFRAPKRVRITPPDAYGYKTLAWNMGTVCERGTIQVTPMRFVH